MRPKDLDVPKMIRCPKRIVCLLQVQFQDPSVRMVSQDFLVLPTNKSILFQTMDATWMLNKNEEEDKDELIAFILKRKMEKSQDFDEEPSYLRI